MTGSFLTALTHGWGGLAMAYTLVEAPLAFGLFKGRAAVRKIAMSPLVAVPLTAAAGVGMALINPLMSALGIGSEGLLHAGLASALVGTASYLGGRALAREGAGRSIYQRGAIVEDTPVSTPPSQSTPVRSHELTLAQTRIPPADEMRHYKIIGITGTGKTTAINGILSGALARSDRAIIADPDGTYFSRHYDAGRNDLILNPFDGNSVKWDLFGEIRTPYDVEQVARALIPDEGSGDDRSWRNYARTFFTAVTQRAHAAGIGDVGELYRLLVMASREELIPLVEGTPAQPFLDEDNGRMFDSIRSVASSAVAGLQYVAQQQGPSLSIRDWVSSGPSNLRSRGETGPASQGVLFIPYQAGQIAALRPMISAWMRLGIFEAMNQTQEDHRLWFVIDELDALGAIDGLKDALARLRKFGGRVILGLQSIAQASSTYGMGEAQTIVENAGTTLILRSETSEKGGTAQFASELIGRREVKVITRSRTRGPTDLFGSRTESEHFALEPAVLPAQIAQLPDRQGYLKLASSPGWKKVFIPHPDNYPIRTPWRSTPVRPVTPGASPQTAAATSRPTADAASTTSVALSAPGAMTAQTSARQARSRSKSSSAPAKPGRRGPLKSATTDSCSSAADSASERTTRSSTQVRGAARKTWKQTRPATPQKKGVPDHGAGRDSGPEVERG